MRAQDHGHRQSLVAEEGGDSSEAHTSVDRLSGQGVAQLVGREVADASLDRLVVEDLADPVAAKRAVAFDEEPSGEHANGPVVGDPVVEELFELGMQRDVAVVVDPCRLEFAARTLSRSARRRRR